MSLNTDSDDDNRYEMKKMMVCHHAKKMRDTCLNALTIFGKYCESWVFKAEPRTSILSGFEWLRENIDTPGETYTMLRMSTKVLFDLHDLLVQGYGLTHSPYVSSFESLAMFLWTLGGANQIEEPKTVSSIQPILSTANFMRCLLVLSRCQLTI